GVEPVLPCMIASARERSGLFGANPPGRLGRFGFAAGGGGGAACPCPSLPPLLAAARRGGGRRLPQRAHWAASSAFSWAQNGQKRMRGRPIINLPVLKDHASGHDCKRDLRAGKGGSRDCTVEDRQIGDLARHRASAVRLLEGGKGGFGGKCAHRFRQRELLIGQPTAGRMALRILTRH